MLDFAREYLDIINGELKGLNLTRITDLEEFYEKQVIDSIEPIKKSKFFTLENIVDVGFGGGFPLLPLAKLFPRRTFLGLDARKKKVIAVERIAELLSIGNVSVAHERLENVYFDRKVILTAKAVAPITKLLASVSGVQGSLFYFYKGPLLDEKESGLILGVAGWSKIEDFSMEIGSNSRRLLVFEKNNANQNNKNLVNYSSLI